MKVTTANMKQIREALDEVRNRMLTDMQKNFILLDQGDVDDQPWYTIQIQNREIWFWLTQQEGKWSHYHCEVRKMPLVDMEERVYLALVMRWS